MKNKRTKKIRTKFGDDLLFSAYDFSSSTAKQAMKKIAQKQRRIKSALRPNQRSTRLY